MRIAHPLLLLFAIALVPALASAQWAGEEQDVDGVTHVYNPATGVLPPLQVKLTEQFRLGGWDGGEDEFFGVISDVMVDEAQNFYVLDSQLSEIKVYDESGSWLRTIGREGEGPGEFRRPADMSLMPSGAIGVVQPWPSKMVLLTADGDPAGDFSFTPRGEGFAGLSAATRVGDRLAIVYTVSQPDREKGEFRRTLRLGLFEESGTEVAELTKVTSAMQFSNQTVVETDWNHFDRAWTAAEDGRIYARDSFTDYSIQMWNGNGELDRVIHREYAPHLRNADETEMIKERWAARLRRWVREPEFEIEKNWNPIESMFAREDGTLWVRTSRGTRGLDDGVMASFDVFDAQGRFEREVILPGEFDADRDGLFVTGGYVIVVTDLVSASDAFMGGPEGEMSDEEPEPMEIICYQMDLSGLARAQGAGR